jgi:hypothetical protein
MDESLPDLGDLEREVMQLVWAGSPVTANRCANGLGRRLKESTVRTVLRRLEDKGYVGERPNGFARFELDKDGKLGVLRLTFDDRQAYELQRE